MESKEAKEVKVKFTVRSPLNSNGVLYGPGETIELMAEEAAAIGEAVGPLGSQPIPDPR